MEEASALVRTAWVQHGFFYLSWSQDWMACAQQCGASLSVIAFEISHSVTGCWWDKCLMGEEIICNCMLKVVSYWEQRPKCVHWLLAVQTNIHCCMNCFTWTKRNERYSFFSCLTLDHHVCYGITALNILGLEKTCCHLVIGFYHWGFLFLLQVSWTLALLSTFFLSSASFPNLLFLIPINRQSSLFVLQMALF